jgi:hypothetical protein
VIFLLVSLPICTGCVGIEKHQSPEAIIATHKLVNPEGSIAVWQDQMEAEGFECEMIENGTFSTTYKKKHRIDNADFLRCRRETADGVNDVALVIEDGVVTDSIIDFESK